ncbi:hypothetical protein O6H91_16G008600 [Diphasiastrum complanatum]|uniref:Uncharacterized protein n=1 Tax=Diphasiastrum complanatum TaxID=34168 RepID=A0ACC2B9R7_DIPCM|nr:hypothetical protein O6H91_16G008600 [Diphasiastrum complanatum]
MVRYCLQHRNREIEGLWSYGWRERERWCGAICDNFAICCQFLRGQGDPLHNSIYSIYGFVRNRMDLNL